MFAYKFAAKRHVLAAPGDYIAQDDALFLASTADCFVRDPAQFLPSTADTLPTMTHNLPSLRHGWIRPRSRAAAVWLLAATLAPSIALATLGEDSPTVERDVAQLHAQRTVTATTAYSVHELQLPGGTQVREYLTNANRVFAVTWSGPSIPDLQQLLGTYLSRYSAAAQAMGRSRRPVTVHDSDLVIRTGGHARAFFGVAYLPGQMPSGVRAEEIR
jgi:hypothetical protein